MQPHRHRSLSTWIAILAILLNALMPTLSVALERPRAPSGNSGWIEVCSTQGTFWVRLAPDGQLLEQTTRPPENTAPAAQHGEHCLYCLSHAGSFGLAPSSYAGLPAVPPRNPALGDGLTATFTAYAWRAPAARAPPVSLA